MGGGEKEERKKDGGEKRNTKKRKEDNPAPSIHWIYSGNNFVTFVKWWTFKMVCHVSIKRLKK